MDHCVLPCSCYDLVRQLSLLLFVGRQYHSRDVTHCIMIPSGNGRHTSHVNVICCVLRRCPRRSVDINLTTLRLKAIAHVNPCNSLMHILDVCANVKQFLNEL